MNPDESSNNGLTREATLLRIFIGDGDRHEGHTLYEAIVLKARASHLAGATVLKSPMGFGRTSRLHTAKILQLSTDLPIVIEIVDRPVLDAMMDGGMVTLEKVRVVHYRAQSAETT